MTTELAFRIMISSRGIYKKLAVTKGTVARWRHNIKTGSGSISLDRKVDLLKKAGFILKQEMRWTLIAEDAQPLKKEIDYLNDFPGLTLIGKRAGMHDETIRRANKAIVEDPSKFRKIYKQMA